MTTIKSEAYIYEPPRTKNIADLEAVSVEMEIFDGEGEDGEGKEFKYKYLCLNNEEYRVPGKVLEDLKEILQEKPNLKTFKVKKKGEGKKTRYTLVTLEEGTEDKN